MLWDTDEIEIIFCQYQAGTVQLEFRYLSQQILSCNDQGLDPKSEPKNSFRKKKKKTYDNP